MSHTLPNHPHESNGSQQPLCPLQRLADERRLPLSAFADQFVRPALDGKVVFPVYDQDHKHLYDVVRNPPGTRPPCYVKKGTVIVPYGRWRLPPPAARTVLWLVEGCTDTITLWHAGVVALGVHSAHHAQTLERDDLDGFAVLVVVREPDRGGDFLIPHLTEHVRQLVPDAQLWEVRMPDGIKDVSALWMDDPLRFCLRLAEVFERRTLLYPCGYSVNGAASPAGPAAARAGPGAGAVLGKTRSSAGPPPDTRGAGPLPKKVGEPTGERDLPKKVGDEPAGPCIPGIDWRTLDATDYPRDWLVDGVLVHRQPAVIGGPHKVLKTTLLIDLALSLASATPFLGHFKVPKRVPVWLFSCESGEATIQETARRICQAKGIRLADQQGRLSFDLPRLADPAYLARLCAQLRTIGPEGLVIFDPTYASLGGAVGSGVLNPGNVFAMGELLLSIAHAVQATGWTPLLAHHATKEGGRTDRPLDLADLSQAGFRESARQWLLVNRRAPYEPGGGLHELWLSVGGSATWGSLWGLDVRERDDQGEPIETNGGPPLRCYRVDVLPGGDLRRDAREEREAVSAEARADRERAREERLLEQMTALEGQLPDGWVSHQALKDVCGFNADTMHQAVAGLVRRGVLEAGQALIPGGPGGKTPRAGRAVRRPAM